MDSLEGSYDSVIIGSPSESTWLLPQSHIPFFSPHVLLVSGSLDLVCDGEVPLIYMSVVHALPGVANNYVIFFYIPHPPMLPCLQSTKTTLPSCA
jgi:hypothetical protein